MKVYVFAIENLEGTEFLRNQFKNSCSHNDTRTISHQTKKEHTIYKLLFYF